MPSSCCLQSLSVASDFYVVQSDRLYVLSNRITELLLDKSWVLAAKFDSMMGLSNMNYE